jgi:Mn2+/Fe2+ NRAMP family transporter
VFTASQAGAKFGFTLLWAVVFASVTGMILQEMSGRLGIATGSGLAQAIDRAISSTLLRRIILGLIIAGIFVGNSAFQTGNLIGAAGGIEVAQDHWSQRTLADSGVTPPVNREQSSSGSSTDPNSDSRTGSKVIPLLTIAALAWSLILIGRFEWIQRILTGLVILMSITFLFAAYMASPSLPKILSGLVPSIPPDSGWVILGLIGTTVVPYNLFLHASAAAHRWPAATVTKASDRIKAVQDSAKNTRFYVGIGGLVTAAILITAAVAFDPDRNSGASPTGVSSLTKVDDFVIQLEPAVGSWATIMFGLGLFAAGLTSAITAPVAAAYAVAGSFGWPNQLSDWRLKAIASIVLLTGFQFALLFGECPQDAILIAQVANGFLLPLLAILLTLMVNRVDLVTRFHNRPLQNLMSITVIVIVSLIAARQLVMVYPKIRNRFFQPAVVLVSCEATSPLATEV